MHSGLQPLPTPLGQGATHQGILWNGRELVRAQPPGCSPQPKPSALPDTRASAEAPAAGEDAEATLAGLGAAAAAAAAEAALAATPPASPKEPFWSGQRVRLSGGAVNYVLDGPEGAPLVVCVHGLHGSIATFERLAPQLKALGLRVLLYDLYGFGRSAATKRPDRETYVRQLTELIDALAGSETQVSLLAFSMGGVVASEFARRQPERVARLLLVAPAGLLQRCETPCQPLVFGVLRRQIGVCFIGPAAAALFCLSSLGGGCVRRRALKYVRNMATPDVEHPEQFEAFSELNAQRLVHNLSRSIGTYLRVLRHMPLWEEDFEEAYAELAAGPVPTLFLWGTNDGIVPWDEVGNKTSELFAPRGASCIFFPKAGHGVLLERAAEVAACAAAWFKDARDPQWLARLEASRLQPRLSEAASAEAFAARAGGAIMQSDSAV